jgi:Mg-chelatase subunit ChlI
MKSPRIRRRIPLGPVGSILLLVTRSCHCAPLWVPTTSTSITGISLTTTASNAILRNGRNKSLLDLRGGESAMDPSKKKKKRTTGTTTASIKQSSNKKPSSSSSSSSAVKTKKKKSNNKSKNKSKSRKGDNDDGKTAVDQALAKDPAQALGDAIR